ncbi:hypothetical protein SESBI_20187 [Sesbania bispinosa]|nr:hypothetical protein SESBI_20187 [Sesbania bispinosa]
MPPNYNRGPERPKKLRRRQPNDVNHPTKLRRTHTSNRCGRCLAYDQNTRSCKNPPNATEGESRPAQPKKNKKSVKKGGNSDVANGNGTQESTVTQTTSTNNDVANRNGTQVPGVTQKDKGKKDCGTIFKIYT